MAPSAGETFSLIRAGNDIFISGGNMQFRYFRNYGALENSVPLSKYEQATVFTRLTNLSNAPNIGPHYTISDCLQRVGNECSKWGFVQLPSYPTLPPVYDAFLTVSSVVGKNDAFTITGPNLPTTALNMIEVTAGKQKYITIPWTLAKALGIRSPLPPIFIPFSGGRISMDLDCDGFVDPGLLISPILAANPFVPIPTLSEWGMIIMLAALMGYGIIRLRRSGHKLTLS
jgi:hypothetical protein